jgi:hypothetical protein
MKYALLIYDGPRWASLGDEERNAAFAEYVAINEEPAVVGGAQLSPAETATTVRQKDLQTLTTDGPFAETKEVFGGYFIVEADDLDGALAIAERIPAVRFDGAVEVRPVVTGH